ncbi:MAG: hypothetical protein GY750_03130 [Lentisphaerae bacterium]|nr:hypothetical protein [Lentisphaerota bacterium]MCP4100411.1 hypothetical protein [Lentisphaerota bacterium]
MSDKLCKNNHKDNSKNDSSWLNVAYVQLDATGSLAAITEAGIKALDIVVLAFADTTSADINPSHLKAMQDIINKENPDTINLLSIGGETVISIPDPALVISNISSQITEYNNQLKNGKITGVDLDLENGIDVTTITKLAQGFKEKGYIVSAAPQIYTSGSDIDIHVPVNLVFSSGGANNNYGIAIEHGYVDYILAQTYNTGGFKIGGYEENQVEFFYAVSQALNSVAVRLKKIPDLTKIVIGEPANQGAGGNYTIFNPYALPPVVRYDHAAILAQLLELKNSILKTVKTSKESLVL